MGFLLGHEGQMSQASGFTHTSLPLGKQKWSPVKGIIRRQRLKEVNNIAANWQGQGLKPEPWSLLETEDWAYVVIVDDELPRGYELGF